MLKETDMQPRDKFKKLLSKIMTNEKCKQEDSNALRRLTNFSVDATKLSNNFSQYLQNFL